MIDEHATTATIAQDGRHRCAGCGRPFTSKTLFDVHVSRCVVTSARPAPPPLEKKGRAFGQRVTLDQQAQRHRLVEEAKARLAAAVAPYETPALSEGSSTALADDAPSVRAGRSEGGEAPSASARSSSSGKRRQTTPKGRGATLPALARATPPPTFVESAPPAAHPTSSTTPAVPSTRKPRPDLDELDAYLIRTHETHTAKQQAVDLGRTYSYVVARRMTLARRGRLDLKRARYAQELRDWTEAEETYLREHIGALSFEEMGRHLGRTAVSLIVHSKRCGITRADRKANRDTLNAYDVGKILGQDPSQYVLREIIAWGLLRATRHPWLRANGRNGRAMQWAIKREDLVDFLIDYPWQYDHTRITDPFFRRVADEAWNRDPLYTTTEVAPMLGVKGQHNVSSFLMNTAPKFIPRSKLIVRRKGNPKAFKPRSFTGMTCFIPKSTIDAIKASGWVNYRTVLEDPEKLTAERAAQLLYGLPERPRYLTKSVLMHRARRFYALGAIATQTIKIGARHPWVVARPADVLALKDAFFARTTVSRLTATRRAMIGRHAPELLKDARALALAIATGSVPFAEWRYQEIRAAQELRWAQTKKWALVTRHVRRMLEHIGRKTKLGGSTRIRIYHSRACSPGLVQFPLEEARRRGLVLCEFCAFEAKSGARRRGRLVELPTCSSCGITYKRGRGRPPKVPTCPGCKSRPARRAA
jgi:hypothetical protein